MPMSAVVHPEDQNGLAQALGDVDRNRRRRSSITTFLAKSGTAALLTRNVDVSKDWSEQDNYESIRWQLDWLAWLFDVSGTWWPRPDGGRSYKGALFVYAVFSYLYPLVHQFWFVYNSENSSAVGALFSVIWMFLILVLKPLLSQLLRKDPLLALLISITEEDGKLLLKKRARKVFWLVLFSTVVFLLSAISTLASESKGEKPVLPYPFELRALSVCMFVFWAALPCLIVVPLLYCCFWLFERKISSLVKSFEESTVSFKTSKDIVLPFQEIEALLRLLCSSTQPLLAILLVTGGTCSVSALFLVIMSVFGFDGYEERFMVNFACVNAFSNVLLLYALYRMSRITEKIRRLAQLINVFGFNNLSREDHMHSTHYIEMAMQNQGASFRIYGLPITGGLAFKATYILCYVYGIILVRVLGNKM